MAIGVIFTGGTIGSLIGADGFIGVDKTVISDSRSFRLLNLYYEKYDSEHKQDFVTRVPYTILSENLDFEHLNLLAKCVADMAVDSNLSGIIVTHGTDSLQYSAAFIKYMCEGIGIPVVFVSSAYVLDDDRANGVDNFNAAVLFIDYAAKAGKKGVFVAYKNDDGRMFIHRAEKLCAHRPFSADLYSIRDEYEAEYIGTEFICKNIDFDDSRYTNKSENNNLEYAKKLTGKNVLRVPMYPGSIYPYDRLESGIKAVLIDTYHSGTIRTNDELKKFARIAKNNGVILYVSGLSSKNNQYETVREYEELGLNIIYDEAPIAAYCRLCVELS